jgi:glycosyltransferase involved in cell wall biosynthesis/O-antigen/teichoic acid export membrane protein
LMNFLFNAFLSRNLTLEQLSVVTLINTLWGLIALLLSAVGTTVNHRSAYLIGEGQMDNALGLRRRTLMRGSLVVIFAALLWAASTPFLSAFFHMTNPWAFLLFIPMFSFGFTTVINSGFLQGQIKLVQVAKIYLFESSIKLIVAAVLIITGLEQWVFVSVPASVVAVALFTAYLFSTTAPKPKEKIKDEKFSANFYFSALFSMLSATLFLNLDVLLVNHYLTPVEAGSYALLSLVGKMVYYFGSLPNSLIVTFVSRDLGKARNPQRTFYLLFFLTFVFVGSIALTLTMFGNFIIPILLGSRTLGILQFVPLYVFAMAMFTLTNSLVTYHLAREQYAFPFASLLISILLAASIVVRHNGAYEVVNDIVSSSAVGLSIVLFMHVLSPWFEPVPKWFKDLFGLWGYKHPQNFELGGKRILIFNWRDTKHKFAGGAEVYIHELAKNWTASGNEVTVFCGNDGKSLRSEIVDGVNVVRHGGFYMVYFWAVLYYIFHFRGKFDIIIDCENGIPFFAPLYAHEPVLCLMHHVHQEVFRRSLSWPLATLARFLEKSLMPLVYKNVRFITISESSKNSILSLGLATAGIDVVHPGVNLEHALPAEINPPPNVLYLGRLKDYKSVDVLIKAFRFVVNQIADSKLIIAGSGEEETKLRKLTHDLSLTKNVEFRGHVTEEEKWDLMHKAWVFVNPSFMEGWGITTIEANACGVPVVAADVPGLRDSVKNPHTGFLVEHGNSSAFAQKITLLLEDSRLRKELGQNALEWAQNFYWEKTSSDFLNIIREETMVAKQVYDPEQI